MPRSVARSTSPKVEPDATDVMQGDLRDLLLALGMGDHSRPQSPHEVFQEALTVLRARLGPPAEPAPRLSRREKAIALAEVIANRWDAFHDRNGIHWLAESILAFKTEEDERVIAWANRSVRSVQDHCFAEMDALKAALGQPFLTGHSGCEGGPFVKLKYDTLAEATAAHEALARLLQERVS